MPALFENYTKSSAPPNRRAARYPDKILLNDISLTLVQIQNNFTELFLMMPSTIITQMVPLLRTEL